MDTIGPLISIILFLGGAGFLVGWIAGLIVRRRSTTHTRRNAWMTALGLAVVIGGLGVALALSIKTVPSSTADARSHDYALAGLWIAVALWLGVINAVGAACGVGLSMFWTNVRARRPA